MNQSIKRALILGFFISSAFYAQSFASAAPAPVLDEAAQSTSADMTAHSQEMQELLTRLQTSFQAIVAGRDPNGYVKDKALLKAHQADLDAFKDSVRQHKLLTADYDHWCGKPGEKQDAMDRHQQRMKSVLYDLDETYQRYLKADDHSIETGQSVETALNDHKEALISLKDAMQQHQESMATDMKSCK